MTKLNKNATANAVIVEDYTKCITPSGLPTHTTEDAAKRAGGALDNLVREYERVAIECGIVENYSEAVNNPSFVDALDNLAKALAFSVLKTKRLRVSRPHMVEAEDGTLTETTKHYNTMMDDITVGLKRTLRMLDREQNVGKTVGYAVNRDKFGDIDSYIPKGYGEDGELDEEGETKTDEVKASTGERMEDGFEVLQEARAAILEETKRSIEMRGTVDLSTEFTVHEVNHRAYTRKENFCKAFVDRETDGVDNAYLSVSRSITDGRASYENPNHPTILIPFGISDPESGEDAGEVYLRRKVNMSTREDGATEVLTPENEADADTVFDLMDRAGFTAQQRKIIEMRFAGYGRKAIATAMNAKLGTVNNQLKRAGEKLMKIGIKLPNA